MRQIPFGRDPHEDIGQLEEKLKDLERQREWNVRRGGSLIAGAADISALEAQIVVAKEIASGKRSPMPKQVGDTVEAMVREGKGEVAHQIDDLPENEEGAV